MQETTANPSTQTTRSNDLAKMNKILEEKNQELENAQDLLQQVIDGSIEYISVFDKDLRCITVNRKFEEAISSNRTELKGKRLFDINPKAEGTVQQSAIFRALKGE